MVSRRECRNHQRTNRYEVAGFLRDWVLPFAAQSCSVGDNATNAREHGR
jgi:hypothetical protein